MTLNLSVSIDQAKLVVRALAALPFHEVAELINSITQQANSQIEAAGSQDKPAE